MRLAVMAACVTMLAGLLATSPMAAEDAKVETVSIPSVTPKSFASLSLKIAAELTPVMVRGELYLPAQSIGPLPAMVVMHGSGGPQGASGNQVRSWGAQLARWGVAALVIDGFTPRGVDQTYANQAALSVWASVADALAGLKVLAADPRIDRSRIGVMGFSRGGRVSILTALDSVRRGMIEGDLKFAVHIPFYASGETQFFDRATDRSPMLFLHGAADDYTPMAPTKEYAQWFERMGNPVTFIAYPGAYHNFDQEGGFSGYARRVEVYSECSVRIDVAEGKVLRLGDVENPARTDWNALRSYYQSCMKHGATIAPDRAARADAIQKVHDFLVHHFHIG